MGAGRDQSSDLIRHRDQGLRHGGRDKKESPRREDCGKYSTEIVYLLGYVFSVADLVTNFQLLPSFGKLHVGPAEVNPSILRDAYKVATYAGTAFISLQLAIAAVRFFSRNREFKPGRTVEYTKESYLITTTDIANFAELLTLGLLAITVYIVALHYEICNVFNTEGVAAIITTMVNVLYKVLALFIVKCQPCGSHVECCQRISPHKELQPELESQHSDGKSSPQIFAISGIFTVPHYLEHDCIKNDEGDDESYYCGNVNNNNNSSEETSSSGYSDDRNYRYHRRDTDFDEIDPRYDRTKSSHQPYPYYPESYHQSSRSQAYQPESYQHSSQPYSYQPESYHHSSQPYSYQPESYHHSSQPYSYQPESYHHSSQPYSYQPESYHHSSRPNNQPYGSNPNYSDHPHQPPNHTHQNGNIQKQKKSTGKAMKSIKKVLCFCFKNMDALGEIEGLEGIEDVAGGLQGAADFAGDLPLDDLQGAAGAARNLPIGKMRGALQQYNQSNRIAAQQENKKDAMKAIKKVLCFCFKNMDALGEIEGLEGIEDVAGGLQGAADFAGDLPLDELQGAAGAARNLPIGKMRGALQQYNQSNRIAAQQENKKDAMKAIKKVLCFCFKNMDALGEIEGLEGIEDVAGGLQGAADFAGDLPLDDLQGAAGAARNLPIGKMRDTLNNYNQSGSQDLYNTLQPPHQNKKARMQAIKKVLCFCLKNMDSLGELGDAEIPQELGDIQGVSRNLSIDKMRGRFDVVRNMPGSRHMNGVITQQNKFRHQDQNFHNDDFETPPPDYDHNEPQHRQPSRRKQQSKRKPEDNRNMPYNARWGELEHPEIGREQDLELPITRGLYDPYGRQTAPDAQRGFRHGHWLSDPDLDEGLRIESQRRLDTIDEETLRARNSGIISENNNRYGENPNYFKEYRSIGHSPERNRNEFKEKNETDDENSDLSQGLDIAYPPQRDEYENTDRRKNRYNRYDDDSDDDNPDDGYSDSDNSDIDTKRKNERDRISRDKYDRDTSDRDKYSKDRYKSKHYSDKHRDRDDRERYSRDRSHRQTNKQDRYGTREYRRDRRDREMHDDRDGRGQRRSSKNRHGNQDRQRRNTSRGYSRHDSQHHRGRGNRNYNNNNNNNNNSEDEILYNINASQMDGQSCIWSPWQCFKNFFKRQPIARQIQIVFYQFVSIFWLITIFVVIGHLPIRFDMCP